MRPNNKDDQIIKTTKYISSMEINAYKAIRALLKRSNTKDDQTYMFNEISAYNAFMSEINNKK